MSTPIKSIRKHCIECSGGSTKEVTKCIIDDCNLFFYRMGKNPNRKGIGNSQAFKKKLSRVVENYKTTEMD